MLGSTLPELRRREDGLVTTMPPQRMHEFRGGISPVKRCLLAMGLSSMTPRQGLVPVAQVVRALDRGEDLPMSSFSNTTPFT